MEEYQKTFIANVSHDFRSPLTSIKGYLEAILDGTIPPEMQEKYLTRVISETDRLNKLTQGLLTLNSLDSKGYLSRSNFDINRVIKDTAASFEGTCDSKNIVLDLTFAENITMVYADLGKIQQVLYNLIDNAINSATRIPPFSSRQHSGLKRYMSPSRTQGSESQRTASKRSGNVFIRQTCLVEKIRRAPALAYPL